MTVEFHLIVLVLGAAVLHAVWNALIKISGDSVLSYALIMVFGGLMAAPALPFVGLPSAQSLPYLVLSVVFAFLYFGCLLAGYRHGDLSQVYPLARGTGPLFATLGAILFVGEALSVREASGVVLASVGIIGLAAGRGRVDPRPIAYAALGGVAIGVYTVSDWVGIRLSGNPAGYIVVSFMTTAVAVAGLACALRGRAVLPFFKRNWRYGPPGGLMVMGAYGPVVWALAVSPVAHIAALRETSVVIAALIGAIFLKEPLGTRRVIAALVVTAGLLLLNLNI